MLSCDEDVRRLLPRHWSVVEVVDEILDIGGLQVRRAGVSARSSGGHVATGSAASLGARAFERACFELLERVAVLEALHGEPVERVVREAGGTPVGSRPHDDLFVVSDEPERWQPSRSNGVALGPDWPSACRSAMLELVERDRLLRSWAGEGTPVRITSDATSVAKVAGYDWQAFRFPHGPSWSAPIEVVMVIGFPHDPAAPLVRGSAADEVLARALERAAGECLQNLAFLWGEAIPPESPAPSTNPLYHLDRFLWPGAHAVLRAWLAGAHTGLENDGPCEGADPRVAWVDLTPSAWNHAARVAQAQCAAAVPLFFGDGSTWWRSMLPEALWAHPIA